VLPRRFFERDPLVVAPELLGAVLEHDLEGVRVGVRLTEVEAYLGEGEDPASHSYRGLRSRNAVMFGPPGHAYIYFTYGMHWCANVVCRPDGISGGVLLRAGEVVRGLEVARRRRPAARRDTDLARGPARLASALGLTGADNGRDVCAGDGAAEGEAGDGGAGRGSAAAGSTAEGDARGGAREWLAAGRGSGLRMLAGEPVAASRLRAGPRVGVTSAGAASPWRWWLDGEPTVSVYRPAKVRRRSP
jgi:DNA-3-methyladenine glycosylase